MLIALNQKTENQYFPLKNWALSGDFIVLKNQRNPKAH
ncbi:hypothetical protein PEPS_13440 [Persicobacter psychrovividus]|uniref:Uncharacterized protein n=1 Tax=Persicobacter psychrovividus TaxID=387638 RepID=A0ABM7VDP8_9BACT|nr:hypothetical protein PEPS_13440 [Persicobacter psychrovividus]